MLEASSGCVCYEVVALLGVKEGFTFKGTNGGQHYKIPEKDIWITLRQVGVFTSSSVCVCVCVCVLYHIILCQRLQLP